MMVRLIDAEKLNAVLQNQAEHLTENGDAVLAACLIVCQETVERQPTIEATPINNNPCGFCGKFNFGDAKAEVYRHGANIVIASALARFPVEEQFNFCPVCGRFVKKGR